MSEYYMPHDRNPQLKFTWRDLTAAEIEAQKARRARFTKQDIWSQWSPYLRSVPEAEATIMNEALSFDEAVAWTLNMIKNQPSLKNAEMEFRRLDFLPTTRIKAWRKVETIDPNERYIWGLSSAAGQNCKTVE